MNSYRYKALNKAGRIEKGDYECEDIKRLFQYLQQRELLLVRVITKSKRLNLVKLVYNKKMTLKQLSLFCKQMASILDSGMPLVQAFTILSADYRGTIKERIEKITNELIKGETLYYSMLSCGNMFPNFMLQMVNIGENSGKLDKIFMELSAHFQKQYKLKQKIINASIYPIIVLVMSQVAVMFLMTTIVPSMMELIKSSGGKIPVITEIMFSVSSFISKNIILIVALLSLGVIYFLKLITGNKLDIYEIVRRIKVFRKVSRKIISYDILTAIWLVYSSGGNIIHGIESSIEMIQSNYIRKQINNAVLSVKEGMAISSSLSEIEAIDQVSIALIKIGEGSGKLEDMLEKAINIVEDDVDGYINKFSELIQPISILFLAIVVAVIMLAVMVPMFTLYNTI